MRDGRIRSASLTGWRHRTSPVPLQPYAGLHRHPFGDARLVAQTNADYRSRPFSGTGCDERRFYKRRSNMDYGHSRALLSTGTVRAARCREPLPATAWLTGAVQSKRHSGRHENDRGPQKNRQDQGSADPTHFVHLSQIPSSVATQLQWGQVLGQALLPPCGARPDQPFQATRLATTICSRRDARCGYWLFV